MHRSIHESLRGVGIPDGTVVKIRDEIIVDGSRRIPLSEFSANEFDLSGNHFESTDSYHFVVFGKVK